MATLFLLKQDVNIFLTDLVDLFLFPPLIFYQCIFLYLGTKTFPLGNIYDNCQLISIFPSLCRWRWGWKYNGIRGCVNPGKWSRQVRTVCDALKQRWRRRFFLPRDGMWTKYKDRYCSDLLVWLDLTHCADIWQGQLIIQ